MMNPSDALDELVVAAKKSFADAATPADLENAKAIFLGKSGRVTDLMKGLASLSVEEKKIPWCCCQPDQAGDRGGAQ